MINKAKIGETEAIALLTTSITTKSLLATPAVYVTYGGSAAWMIVVISGLVTSALFWIIIKFLQRFPENTLPDTAEEIAGPLFGTIIVLTFVMLWAFDVSMALRRFSEMIILVTLPDTPISVILSIFLLAAYIAVYMGIQNIAKACYVAFPFSVAAILLIVLLTHHLWNTNWLFPFLGDGVKNIAKYGLLRGSDYVELNLLYAMPFLFYPKKIKTIGFKSIGISILVFLTVIFGYTLAFPAVAGEEAYLPLYMMARNVYLGRFLQRVEAIFVVFWVVSAYLWISAGIYGICLLLTRMLKLPDYRPLILPIIIILFAAAFISANLPDTLILSDYIYRNIQVVPLFGFPVVLLIIAMIRGKGVKSDAKK